MPETQTDLAATIGARICHDLISPIGAISNGLELLALSGSFDSREMALISESVKSANAKVRFLRIAFGSADANALISATEISEILANAYTDPRTKICWTMASPMARLDVQLLFLLILCAEKIAPYGGAITVCKGGHGFDVIVTGKNLKTDGFLDFQDNNLMTQNGPSLVQFKLAEAQLAHRGYTLDLVKSYGEIRIGIQT
ncbi:MAG: histidine phosphotransferase family protein [Rhodobacterales bacterium]